VFLWLRLSFSFKLCFVLSWFMSVLVDASICFPFTYYQSCFVCRFYFLHLSVSLSITQYQRCHTKVDTKPNICFNIDIRHQTQLHVRFWTRLPSLSKDTNRREQTIANRCVVYRMLVYNSQTGGERGEGWWYWLVSKCQGTVLRRQTKCSHDWTREQEPVENIQTNILIGLYKP